MSIKTYSDRHIGPDEQEVRSMLSAVDAPDLDTLIDRTVPQGIRLQTGMELPPALAEHELLEHLQELAEQNKNCRSYIGQGYYRTHIPSVIQRNVLENPGWYTAYTPYQAEISQGRLEALLNFQTVVSDLTGLPLANASLLDEGTAAAEAMLMLFSARSRDQVKGEVVRFFVDRNVFPQTKAVLKTRALPLGIQLIEADLNDVELDGSVFGMLVQYPAADGSLETHQASLKAAKERGIRIAVATDLLALTLLAPPGEWGADVAVGNSQRFGVPMGFGGPHAGFFATTQEFKRLIPGRIIGVSVDRHGDQGYRMALQTREQHIRRDKATSNICTAQALLAVMAGMYATYHGPAGLEAIATKVHRLTSQLASALFDLGYEVKNQTWFDTLTLKLDEKLAEQILRNGHTQGIELRHEEGLLGVSLDETTEPKHLNELVALFAKAAAKDAPATTSADADTIPKELRRTSVFLQHPVFNSHHTETEMMRYLKRLENKDISLTRSMIALGSCTMKLNAASTLMAITWPEFAHIHPFAPLEHTLGYQAMFNGLSQALGEITGLPGVSLQPNSGAQGEYAGLMVIRGCHLANDNDQRKVVLIPSSAHGTNPASAVMAGMRVVVVKCDERGNIDIPDLQAKTEKHSDELAALMVTYPSTHGVFEAGIKQVTQLIHDHGGLVYMDGANMNAQVGLTSPGEIGADVCHLNLHKTFAIPHGGGGPGMGPICVTEDLTPFLPDHPLVKTGGTNTMGAVSAAPWGSSLILLISYAYIRMLGADGLTRSTKNAILNANYIKARLEKAFPVLYVGENGTVAHELILDCRGFKRTTGIEVEDIAKRLIDHGFHAPTVSFPVAGTLMVEPTESENQQELDHFCEALLSIRDEIGSIENSDSSNEDNALKMAPHTAQELCADKWTHPYTRREAAFPLDQGHSEKYWPPVGRIDQAYGDRNLVCTCPSTEEYAEVEASIAN